MALRPRNNRARFGGFTLLEILLALVLAGMLLSAIGMAINTHMRVVDSSRTGVEDARLANTVLRHIANDIAATLRHEKFDPSGLTSAASKSSASQISSAAKSALGDSAAIPSESDIAGALTDTETSDTMPKLVPGLYGYADYLQIDIARLPRLDEYASVANGNVDQFQPPSDVKTVVYYWQAAAGDSPGGLMRRELPRLTTLYASQNGHADELNLAAQAIAPEVTGINLAYFDGIEWFDTWDSTTMEMLPVAVEVQLRMAMNATSPNGEPVEKVFRTVVQLAAGQPTIEEPKPEAEAATGGTTGASGSTGSGASGGQSGASGGSSKGSSGSGASGGSSKGSSGSGASGSSSKGSSSSGGSTSKGSGSSGTQSSGSSKGTSK